MLTEEIAIKLILQELGASPNALRTTLVHNGEIKMYLVHMGRYDVKATACDEKPQCNLRNRFGRLPGIDRCLAGFLPR